MSASRAILRLSRSWKFHQGRPLCALNQVLCDDFPSGKFVTMIYAVLDARSREITLASAGHLPSLLINGKCSFLEMETGLPLSSGASSYPRDHDQARSRLSNCSSTPTGSLKP